MQRVAELFERSERLDHHFALMSLLEVLEVVTRSEVRGELIQELERQKLQWMGHLSNPAVAQEALRAFVNEITVCLEALHQQVGKADQTLRDVEWLTTVRQRAPIPGAVCDFDLPFLRLWLDGPTEARLRDMRVWFAPLLPIQQGVEIMLRLMRNTGEELDCVTENGTFQRAIVGAKLPQMLQLTLSAAQAPLAPEISANKYAINVRFLAQTGTLRDVVREPVGFRLKLCAL